MLLLEDLEILVLKFVFSIKVRCPSEVPLTMFFSVIPVVVGQII